jgi:hypothetical protein
MFADNGELCNVAFREAANAVDQLTERENRGRGPCPHCGQLQRWMVVSPLVAGAALLLVGGGATVTVTGAVAVASKFLPIAAALELVLVLICAALGFALSAIVAVVAAPLLADRPGPVDDSAPHSKTDDDLNRWLARCSDQEAEPFLTWWVEASDRPPKPKDMVLSMGLLDLATPPLPIPRTLTHAARSAELNRM